MMQAKSMQIDQPGGSDFLPMCDLQHDNSQTDTTCKILMDSDMVS